MKISEKVLIVRSAKTFAIIFSIFLLLFQGVVYAAPSSEIYFPENMISSVDNLLEIGGTDEVTLSFRNTASSPMSDVASTLQYITVCAANLGPNRSLIEIPAQWEIFEFENSTTPRAFGFLDATLSPNAIYSPYSTIDNVYLYIWRIGPPNNTLTEYISSSQFDGDTALKVLRPGEILNLTVTIRCLDIGDSRIWFFLKASEDDFEGQIFPSSVSELSDKCNIYFSKLAGPSQTQYWLPLHNSYDPYDSDLMSGHSFKQNTWEKRITNTAFAKANKLVHQKPDSNPTEDKYSFHICGVKFLGLNITDLFDAGIDSTINGVTVWLLAKLGDNFVPIGNPSSPYYDMLEIAETHGNPVLTGESGGALSGQFCFNLVNVKSGTYEFYLKIDESNAEFENSSLYEVYPAVDSMLIVNDNIIGPIVLSTENIEFSLGNDFGNILIPKNYPVGGTILSSDKSIDFLIIVGMGIIVEIIVIIYFIMKRKR